MPPYNGSGTFTPFTPGNPVVPGTVISSTAFNATQSDIAAGLTNAITRDGQSPPSANLPMGGRKHTGLGAGTIAGDSLRWEQLFSQGTEQDLASAATTDVGAQNTTVLRITGTTGITSFGTNYNGPRFVRFADILTLTHSATLVLPTGANITTAAGDRAILTPIGNPAAGWQVLAYQRANGTALNGIASGPVTSSGLTMATARILGRDTASTGAIEELAGEEAQALLPVQQTRVDVASAATVNITSSVPSNDHINITGTTTITAFTVATGRLIFVRFNAVLTLTNNASIVTQRGANIVTAAGDTCILRATAANVVEVLAYTRGIPQAVGEAQTWQNVTASRTAGTIYTNTTGRPIMVSVRGTAAAPGTSVVLLVSGIVISAFEEGAANATVLTVCAIVPNGATYQVIASSFTVTAWLELLQ